MMTAVFHQAYGQIRDLPEIIRAKQSDLVLLLHECFDVAGLATLKEQKVTIRVTT